MGMWCPTFQGGRPSYNYSNPSMLNPLNLLGLAIAQNTIARVRCLVLSYFIYKSIPNTRGVTVYVQTL